MGFFLVRVSVAAVKHHDQKANWGGRKSSASCYTVENGGSHCGFYLWLGSRLSSNGTGFKRKLCRTVLVLKAACQKSL